MPISSSSGGSGGYVSSKMGVNTIQNPPQQKMPKKPIKVKLQTEKPTWKKSKKQVQKREQRRWK